MQTEVNEAGNFERMLTLRLDESEFEEAKNSAARKLSKSLKIKGFRPGRAPRAVVERMVGSEALRSEAIDEALPALVSTAIDEAELAPVTAPRVEDIRDAAEGGVEVDVRVTLWPTIDEVPDYEGRKIAVDAPDVGDDDVREQIDRLRAQFAELEDVSREADEGDFVLINLTAESPSGEVEEAAANDLLYELGSQSFIPGLDQILVGASAGNIRDGNAVLPEGFGDQGGQEVSLRVLVKGVKARKLPEVTDEWVGDVTEFETVAELEEALRENLAAMKKASASVVLRERLLEQLTEELDIELPDALVEAEMEASLHDLGHRLEEQGVDLATYLRLTGQDENAFVADLRERANRALRTRLLLEAVAAREGIEVTSDEIDEFVGDMAQRTRRPAEEIREQLAETGQGSALTGDILRRKALDRLVAAVVAIDGDGNPVDLEIPEDEPSEEQPSEDEDDPSSPVSEAEEEEAAEAADEEVDNDSEAE